MQKKEFVDRVIKVAIARVFSTLEGGFLEKTTRLFSEKYFDQITNHFKNLEDIVQSGGSSSDDTLKRLFNVGIDHTDDWYIQAMWGKYRFIEELVLHDSRYPGIRRMSSQGLVKRPSTLKDYKNYLYNYFHVTEEDFKDYVKVFDITEVSEILRMPSRQEFSEIKIKLIDNFKKNISFNFNFDIGSIDSEDYSSSMETAEEIIDGKTQIIKKSIIDPITFGYFMRSDNSVTINVPFFYKIYEYEKSTDDEYYEYEKGGKRTLSLLIGTLIHEILHAIDHQLFLILSMPNQILNKILKKYINLRPNQDDKFATYSASDLSTISLGETEIRNVKTAFNKSYLKNTVPKALKEFQENFKLAFGQIVQSWTLHQILKFALDSAMPYLLWDSSNTESPLQKSLCLYDIFKKYGLLKSHVDVVVYATKWYVHSQKTDEAMIKFLSKEVWYGMNAMEIKVRSYSLIEYAKSKGYDLYNRSSFDKFAKKYKSKEIKKEVADMSWFSEYLINLYHEYTKGIFPQTNLQDAKDRAYNIFIYFAGKDVQLTEIFLRHIIRKRILKVLLNERKSIKR